MDFDAVYQHVNPCEWTLPNLVTTLTASRRLDTPGITFECVRSSRAQDAIDLSAWISSKPDQSHPTGLRIVFLTSRNPHAIPMLKETYEYISLQLGLPPIALDILAESLPTYFAFKPQLDKPHPQDRGLIIRGQIRTVTLVYSGCLECTTVICTGFSAAHIEKILLLVQASKRTSNWFVHLPILFADQEVRHLANYALHRNQEVTDQQLALDFTHYYAINSDAPLPEPDLGRVTNVLTSLSQSTSNITLGCEFQLRLLSKLLDMLGSFAIDGPPGISLSDNLRMAYADRIHYLIQYEISAKELTQAVNTKTQALMATVFSVIAQKDAKQTARDSTDMRVIAAVTLFFLPGTFAAAFFSTSFFNFNNYDKPKIISPWIWLYWVITIGLTLLVLGAWWIVSYQWMGKRKDGKSVRCRGNVDRIGYQ